MCLKSLPESHSPVPPKKPPIQSLIARPQPGYLCSASWAPQVFGDARPSFLVPSLSPAAGSGRVQGSGPAREEAGGRVPGEGMEDGAGPAAPRPSSSRPSHTVRSSCLASLRTWRTSHTPRAVLRVAGERPGLGFCASPAQRAVLWRFPWGACGQVGTGWSPGPGAADGDETGSTNSNNNCHPPCLAQPAM